MTDLAAMRAENVAVWRRDIHLPDYDLKVVDSTSRYLPALEAEVDRLTADLLIADEATLVLTARAAAAEAEVDRLRHGDRIEQLPVKALTLGGHQRGSGRRFLPGQCHLHPTGEGCRCTQ